MSINNLKKAIATMLSLALIASLSSISRAADLVPVNNDLHVPFNPVSPYRESITDFSIKSIEAKVKNIFSPNKNFNLTVNPDKTEANNPRIKTLVSDDSGSCGDGVTYSFVADTGTLTISGSGAIKDYSYSIDKAPWHSYNDSIKSLIIKDGVTSIGSEAFAFCYKSLTSVSIPNSVTYIGKKAFYFCGASISIPDRVTYIGDSAFFECGGLTGQLIIPNSVTFIGSSAFSNCPELTSVSIPESVTEIGINAFHYCTKLTSINVDENNKNYKSIDGVLYSKGGKNLFQCPIGKKGSISIPNSVTEIGDFAFDYCNGLTSVSIPNSVISIGSDTFNHCNGLTSISIPNSVTSIESSAFSNCFGLVSVSLPYSLIFIGEYAFSNCPELTSVTYKGTSAPKGTLTVFTSCSKLTEVIVPSSYSSNTFCGKEVSKNHDECFVVGNCGEKVNYSLDICTGTLTIFGVGDMYDYSPSSVAPWDLYRPSITSLIIEDGVTKIGSFAFTGCSKLTGKLIIPKSVTRLGASAFEGCSGITSVFRS